MSLPNMCLKTKSPSLMNCKSLLSATLWLTCLLVSPCYGQITTTENLYKVELIIFEHLYFDTSVSAEYWPKSIYLEYPEHRTELKDPEKEEQRRKEEIERLERKKALMLSTEYLLDNVAVASSESSTAVESEPSTQTNAINAAMDAQDTTKNSQNDEVYSGVLGTLKPFEFLNDEHKKLKPQAEAVARNRAYRVLMHESWLQNMTSKEEAPALLIDAGNQYGNNFELQGTITLHVARYLHIATDLWLSQFVPNVGQEPEYWPEIPASPTQLRWQELEDQILFQEQMAEFQSQAGDSSQNSSQFKINIKQYSQFSSEQQNKGLQSEGLNGESTQSQGFQDEPFEEIKEAEYLVTQISTMRQKRRMRSDELHYIDHPKFGILIKITPFEEKDFSANEISAL